ncbi:MAG: phosphoribosylglycinamide formyltransferase [Prevotellaceae bacterium]|jgi:phosphoribosylglycinamide formyltransferase-1|nr:phosphoribosylglycinamide formyltransferase [Prevotellaceae bacterium]
MNFISILASGAGTNAENLMTFFKKHASIRVGLVLTNNPTAGVIDRAKLAGVPVKTFDRHDFYESETVLAALRAYRTTHIVLAGFLWLAPGYLIEKYPVLNIHPALLPAYGGKGMYGMRVHRAVVANRDAQTGITVHRVDAEYDRGGIIFQATCPVAPDDTPEQLAAKVHALEYLHFPRVVEQWITGHSCGG